MLLLTYFLIKLAAFMQSVLLHKNCLIEMYFLLLKIKYSATHRVLILETYIRKNSLRSGVKILEEDFWCFSSSECNNKLNSE
jgi:hypothetical protein